MRNGPKCPDDKLMLLGKPPSRQIKMHDGQEKGYGKFVMRTIPYQRYVPRRKGYE